MQHSHPAALKVNLRDLPRGATLIVNTDAFTNRNLEKAGYGPTRWRTAASPTTGFTPSR